MSTTTTTALRPVAQTAATANHNSANHDTAERLAAYRARVDILRRSYRRRACHNGLAANGLSLLLVAAGAAVGLSPLVGSDAICLRFRARFVRLDFLFERILQFVRRLLELRNAPSKRPAQFGQLARAEDDECNHENDDEFRHTEGTEHDVLLKWT